MDTPDQTGGDAEKFEEQRPDEERGTALSGDEPQDPEGGGGTEAPAEGESGETPAEPAPEGDADGGGTSE